MAYRYTNTDKWNDAWFVSLKPTEKLLFNYLCDNCDCAGFIEVVPGNWTNPIGINLTQIKGALKGLDRDYGNSNGNGIDIPVTNKYIYNKFYDEQIELSNNNNDYIKFVKILFGENNLKIKLNGVLNLEKQLTYNQFKLVYAEKKKNNISLTSILEDLENRSDLRKRYSLLQRVLLNWMKEK